ncbi:MAG: family ATPase, partial [Mycobacterium sp.]|nr:family ATPase [Mycobacterium sp.]
ALVTIGGCESAAQGMGKLEQGLERARECGFVQQIGRALDLLADVAVNQRRHAEASRYVDEGLDYCSDRGLELFRLYLLSHAARLALNQGRWTAAAELAETVLRINRSSTTPRVNALVVLALVRARRADPGHRALLDEAWSLAEPSGELMRLGQVAAARAEASWLEGDREAVAAAVDTALSLAVNRHSSYLIGELADWRRRAFPGSEMPAGAALPYVLQAAGRGEQAAAMWTELGCPYEAALALTDEQSLPVGQEPLRRALAQLQQLGAKPAAAIVARRLREAGARGLPRGPRAATKSNSANLTPRELEVLALVAEGLRNGDIAARLVVSVRTVDHHVATILRKLEVSTRTQAGAEALRLGLIGQHP